ncbi:hypothetical protein ACFYMW_06685 [Streptomyces sp. NPDC006692]
MAARAPLSAAAAVPAPAPVNTAASSATAPAIAATLLRNSLVAERLHL